MNPTTKAILIAYTLGANDASVHYFREPTDANLTRTMAVDVARETVSEALARAAIWPRVDVAELVRREARRRALRADAQGWAVVRYLDAVAVDVAERLAGKRAADAPVPEVGAAEKVVEEQAT